MSFFLAVYRSLDDFLGGTRLECGIWLAQQFTKLEPRFMQLRFAVSSGAIEHAGDLIVLETFNVVEDEYHAITGRERGHGALQRHPVDRACELRVAAAEVALRCILFRGIDRLF